MAPGSSPATRRRRAALALALLLAAGVVLAIVFGPRLGSPRRADSAGGAEGSATVRRRNLIATDTESGTLGYADPQTVYNRLSGTITWMPSVGQVIQPGRTLYRVDGRPVVLLDGGLPAYRALKAGDSDGVDIEQLNRDLVRLGFADGQITIDRAWQIGTTDAVERWQASLGERQTGRISLGRIVFLPGAQRVTQLDTTCGSTGGSMGPGSGSGSGPANGCGVSQASAIVPASHPEFVDFTTSSTTAPTTTTPSTTAPTTTTPTTTTTTATTPPTTTTTTTTPPTTTTTPPTTTTTTPRSTKPPSRHNPGRSAGTRDSGSGSASDSGKGSSGGNGSGTGNGDSAGNASAILQTTSTQLVVTVDLAASSQSEALVGEHVRVEMPAGKKVAGKITAVSPVAQSSNDGNSNDGNSGNGNNGGGSPATVPVTVTLSGRVSGAGLDNASVSVNFVQAIARHVLSLPVTALLATAGGGYEVQEVAAPHRLIPVTTGLFSAGDVQIWGAGVHEGLQVTDSQG
jgi:hypothetical protein